MINLNEFKSMLRRLLVEDLNLALQTATRQLPESTGKARQVLLLNAQYTDLKKAITRDILAERDIELKTNQIRSNLADLIDALTDADLQTTGSVSSPVTASTPKFVVVYAQEDQPYCTLLNRHLNILKLTKKITVYNVNEDTAGDDTYERAQEEWKNADYMLALITVNLFNSPQWFGMVYDALGAGKRVIPVRIQRTDYEGTGLEKLRSLPSQNRAVSDFSNADEAYTDIVSEIRRLLPK